MKTLILHLSYIHIAGQDDYITSFVSAIARSVRELNCEADECVIVVSGDVAQSGTVAEYVAAKSFFSAVSKAVSDVLGLRDPKWVIVPGNHDCSFRPEDHVMRETLLDAVRKDPTKGTDASMVKACTAPQANFFDFLQSFSPPTSITTQLWYDYRISVGPHVLVFRCLNTAWMSSNPEAPGALLYPASVVPDPEDSAAIVITVFHHPSNWLEPNNRREFLRAIEKSADLVLTGHEHDAANYIKIDSTGIRSEYIEGAVLQDRRRAVPSGFNVLLLDLGRDEKVVAHFVANGDAYTRSSGDLLHQPFKRNRLCGRAEFAPSDAFRRFLDDPAVNLSHPAKDRITLSDIFVWPDFREISYTKKSKPLISAKSFLDRLKSSKRILLCGPDRSGKTALCKQLVEVLRTDAIVPVYVQCAESSLGPDHAVAIIESTFAKQYSRDDLTAYRQLPASRRAVILDGVHVLRLSRAAKIQMLTKLSQHAEYLILTADDMAQHVEDLVYSKESLASTVDFRPFELTQFGHIQRYTLVEKWLCIGVTAAEGRARVGLEWPLIARTIDTVIGKNFVPAFPVFILAILQTREAARPIDVRASTYGYFYERFVHDALTAGAKDGDPVTKREYLARLAWSMYEKRDRSIGEGALRAFHAQYESVMQVRLPFVPFYRELLSADILSEEANYYVFKHDYMYYYFAASYISDRMGDAAVRQAVTEMSLSLHVEEFAYIMLFLAHLSRDPHVIDTMLARARSLYANIQPAELNDDVTFMGDGTGEIVIGYVDDDVTITRRKLLARRDEYEECPAESNDIDLDDDATEPGSDGLDAVLKMNTAFKTLQILGQVLKNFAGAMEGPAKLQVASECYLLGLRVLGAAIGFMRDNEDAVYTHMFQILKRECPDCRESTLLRKAEGAVFYFGQLFSYGIIKILSNALGSEKLLLTYESIGEKFPTPVVGLVNLSLSLDNSTAIPEKAVLALHKEHRKRPLVKSLLRQLVVQHFDLFDVHVITKQRICSKLEIPYRKAVGVDRREILIAAPAFKSPKLLRGRADEKL